MKKYFLAGVLAMMTGIVTKAQMPYTVTTLNEAYQPLSSATNINGSTVWDEESYIVPLGFDFKMDGVIMNKFNLMAGNSFGTDTAGVLSAFAVTGLDLIDRGSLGSSSLSPLRYAVTGNAGSRIFKYEVANAGVADEMYNYNTLNDSVNLQIWIYEGSNVVELRFGSSMLSYMSDYFPFGGPVTGYAKNMDTDNGDFDVIYLLSGNPASPTVDSVESGDINFPSLSSYPANGTVYRFTPKTTTSVKDLMSSNVTVFPTQCSDAVYINTKDMPDTYYQLVSTNGMVVSNGKVEKGNHRIDVSSLAPGMYILRLDNITGYDLRKIVKL